MCSYLMRFCIYTDDSVIVCDGFVKNPSKRQLRRGVCHPCFRLKIQGGSSVDFTSISFDQFISILNELGLHVVFFPFK